MRPWEETWSAGGLSVYFSEERYGAASFYPDKNDQGAEEGVARARLAAQAPAMARFVLAVVNHEIDDNDPFDQEKAAGLLRDAGVIP